MIKGTHHTPEARQRLRNALLGKKRGPHSSNHCLNISKALTQEVPLLVCLSCLKTFRVPRCHIKGRKYCTFSCYRKTLVGKKQSPETIAKRSASMFKCGSAASKKKWKVKNGALVAHYQRVRRARVRGGGGQYTLQEWNNLKFAYDYMCLCCKRSEPEIKLVADHVNPVSRGGSNDISNIQPLCSSCNSQKYISTIDYRTPIYG
jgi:5-methylcytosine-specific restriction endonuclease McrA